MNIVYNLLNELKYQTKESFTFDISSDEDKTPIVVTPFVSVEYPCQTYLVIETENQALSKVNNDYLKALALAFRKADFHESDMDKNTTLVITSARPDTEPLNSDAKVKIEDVKQKNVKSEPLALNDSILSHKKVTKTMTEPSVTITKVYLGSYASLDEAIEAQHKVSTSGLAVSPFVKAVKDKYIVQVGSFYDSQKADDLVSSMKAKGFSAKKKVEK